MKTLNEIMEMIELQEEVIKSVLEVAQNLNINEYEKDILKLMNIDEAPEAKNRLKEAFEPDVGNMKILTCMLYALRYVYENYKITKISDEIFVATMKAFKRFIDEHYAGNNKWAFDRDWWIYRQLSMTIFRIGELEYEMKINKDNKYISVHIPSDTILKIDKVKESIKESYEFFEKYYPDYHKVDYICSSWLLSSDLVNVLPSTSNILKFKNLFTIKSENYNSTGFIKWIYKADYTDFNELPEDTTLQRNLKQYLLAGNSISVAYGVLDHSKVDN